MYKSLSKNIQKVNRNKTNETGFVQEKKRSLKLCIVQAQIDKLQ